MKKNAQAWMFLALTPLAISLTGCGSEKIDSRQIELNNGLVYKHGSDNPFTGEVAFKGSMPSELAAYWNNQIDNIVISGPAAQNIISDCTVHYAAGIIDGNSTCTDQKGNVILEVDYKNGEYDGVSKLSNPDTGNVVANLSWRNGKWDGKLKVFTWNGKLVVNDATWNDGSIDSGKVINRTGEYEYEDGKKNGPARLIGGNSVIATGSYKDDQRDGEWVDSGSASYYEPWLDTLYRTNSALSGISINVSRVDSNWVNGKLEGKISFYRNGNILFADASTSNGEIVPGTLHIYPINGSNVDASQAADGKSPIDACVDAWISAFHKEQGQDAAISNDQLNELQGDCQQGKQAPKS